MAMGSHSHGGGSGACRVQYTLAIATDSTCIVMIQAGLSAISICTNTYHLGAKDRANWVRASTSCISESIVATSLAT